MPTARRSSMAEILPVVAARLRLVAALPPERVLVWLGEGDPEHYQGDQDLVVRLQGMNPDQPCWQGGGGYTLDLTERFDVQLRTRLSLDAAGSAYLWLTDAVNGHLALRNRVLNALVGGALGFLPADADGNVLVRQPVKLVQGRRPQPDKTRSQATEWGSETLSFEVDYLHDLDLTIDPHAVADP